MAHFEHHDFIQVQNYRKISSVIRTFFLKSCSKVSGVYYM